MHIELWLSRRHTLIKLFMLSFYTSSHTTWKFYLTQVTDYAQQGSGYIGAYVEGHYQPRKIVLGSWSRIADGWIRCRVPPPGTLKKKKAKIIQQKRSRHDLVEDMSQIHQILGLCEYIFDRFKTINSPFTYHTISLYQMSCNSAFYL